MIRARGLSRVFAGRDVIGSLDLDVDRGERVALRGPNGSGKTTALRCIAGTLRPSTGDVTVGAHRAGSVAARSLLGVSLAQERSFDLRLSGRANLLFFARLRLGSERAGRSAVDTLVDELELAGIAAQRVANSSTGMVQQLAFARALLGEPPAVLLDEPTRSLDEEARARLWDALDRRASLAVLLTTHSDEDAARCHQTIALGGG
ncbi:MAG: ABC transporter ATP-binding protein [Actinomycetota bacterium]|nr:ABC transporter ATP-binding protein [Actinomycetota bacterium]